MDQGIRIARAHIIVPAGDVVVRLASEAHLLRRLEDPFHFIELRQVVACHGKIGLGT